MIRLFQSENKAEYTVLLVNIWITKYKTQNFFHIFWCHWPGKPSELIDLFFIVLIISTW